MEVLRMLATAVIVVSPVFIISYELAHVTYRLLPWYWWSAGSILSFLLAFLCTCACTFQLEEKAKAANEEYKASLRELEELERSIAEAEDRIARSTEEIIQQSRTEQR